MDGKAYLIVVTLCAGAGSFAGWSAGSPTPALAPAPCTDALKAFRATHPECTNRITYDHGYVLSCVLGDYVITDVIASRDGAMSSFLYTNKRTLAQGICDCDKSEGPACEPLE